MKSAAIGIDLGGTNLKAAIVDAQGGVITKAARECDVARGPEPVIAEMAEIAARDKMQLLVENEGACNVVTCAEVAEFLKLLPQKNVGFNWDPLNGTSQKETPFPDGYALLPKKRIWNVQMKGHSLLDEERKLDWRSIFAQLDKDGYRGCAGLETHYFDGTLIEKSNLSVKEIIRILET